MGGPVAEIRRSEVSGATIARATGFTGRDHPGQGDASVRLSPAGPGSGIWFNGSVQATVANASVSSHATCLRRGRHKVEMVEHLLAACLGCGVTDLAVQTSGAGLPVGDGSAEPYVRLFRRTGVVRYEDGPEPLKLDRALLVRQDGRFIAAVPSNGLVINCLTRYPEFGPQFFSFSAKPGSFVRNVARSRTLAQTEESPAAVRKRFGLSFRLKRTGRFVFAERWRYRDEPCRHKLLDLLGDIALLGRPLEAKVFACAPGHRLNLAFVRRVKKELEA